MIRSHLFAALAVLSLLVVSGCNTEPRWANSQAPQGAVLDNSVRTASNVDDIQVASAREVDLVEDVLNHREAYAKSLGLLRKFYNERGYHDKYRWADLELADLTRVRTFKYILAAEVPAESLCPTDSIPEADEMYAKARKLMTEGGHNVPLLYRQDRMHEALNILVSLVKKYPSSDKIDDAAFYCGEIHKEYFDNHEPIAVKWYERSFTWDPNTPHPARFQAAVVLDYRMHDRARALELYHAVLTDETENKSNMVFASRRVHELTSGVDKGEISLPEGQPAKNPAEVENVH